jgi:hypothetical protein
MAFESIVRPYQTPDYAKGATSAEGGFAESAAPVRLLPGRNGRGKTYQAHYSSTVNVYAVKKPKETQS